jgi:hypothetical protein
VPALARPEPPGDLVHTTSDAYQPSLANLVGHGVGQRLDGCPRVDGVAVEVQQLVELVETQPTVAAEDGEACRSKLAAPERKALVVERWERRLVVTRWSATVAPVDPRPELIAKAGELVDDRPSRRPEFGEPIVDPVQARQEVVALDLETDTNAAIETCGVADHELAVGTDGTRVLGHGCRPR